MNYSDFQNQASSEKITLAILQASKRLMGWVNHAGDVFKMTSFDMPILVSVKEGLSSYTEVASIGEVTASSFYHDKENQTLYVETSDSTNPNGKFIYVTRKFFFSNVPVTVPFDLGTGEEVYFEPQIKSTSQFGVEMDTVNQQNEAIEGSGSLVLYNDQDFWLNTFDKYIFDNQICQIYSWNRNLDASEAKKLFDGRVESKDYSTTQISFKMTDKLGELKGTIPLAAISELGLSNDADLNQAKQRMVLGRLNGYRPINVDVLQDGVYTITGTIAVTNNSASIVGTGTSFLTELVPEDRLVIEGNEYTVNAITSDTSATVSDVVVTASGSGLPGILSSSQPKRYTNRVWKLAGHVLRQPTMTIQAGSTTSKLTLSTTKDLYNGDTLYIGDLGSGEQVVINEVINESIVTLSTSTSFIYPIDTIVHRPSVQKVFMDNVQLRFYRDYTVDPDTAMLYISDSAEENAAPTIESVEQITITNGSKVVTGVGTSFKAYLKPGYIVRPKGTTSWFQILAVDSDTQLTLTRNFTGVTETDYVQYKNYVFDNSESVLSCEVLGRTVDGTSSGDLLKTAPRIVKALLQDANLGDSFNAESFTTADNYFPEELAFAIPEKFDDSDTTTYRDVINKVNKSVFGLLIQNTEFELVYEPLRPVVDPSFRLFEESDIFNLKVKSTNKNMIKTSYVNYNRREYDYLVGDGLISTLENSSDIASFILGTNNTKTYESYLVKEADANRLSRRWLFLLETATSQVTFSTKLQAADLNVNDIICVDHRKMYTRFSGTSPRKFLAIETIKKNGDEVTITAVDLSNAFNRIALITDSNQSYINADEDTRGLAGYYTDQYGLIDNDSDSSNTNLIW